MQGSKEKKISQGTGQNEHNTEIFKKKRNKDARKITKLFLLS